MEAKMAEAMNVLPVLTYRWLKVNYRLPDDDTNIRIKPYTKCFLTDNAAAKTPDVIIEQMNSEFAAYDSKMDPDSRITGYGVSGELSQLGESRFNSGLFVCLAENTKCNEPLIMKYELDEENDTVIDHSVIIAKRNSTVTIVIDYSTIGNVKALHIGTLKIYAEEGSEVKLVKVQRMNDISVNFDSVAAQIDDGAKVSCVQAELGGMKSITNYVSNLGESAESNLYSIYLGDGERVLDLSYRMNHTGRRSVSRIDTRGALKNKASKIFKGTIDFKRGSAKSSGSEQEYVILFDKDVRSQAVPLLLCEEEDVQGQHAASAGKVDESKLFYMMSRGLAREEAMKMIVEASFNPIIDKIPAAELKDAVRNEIHRRLVNETI